MAKSKATHIGECQVCGHIQKLPNDRLSLHGYTKQWGFFNGTCWGARELPLEVSKDLIDKAIADADAHRTRLMAESAALKAGKLAEGTTCWYQRYVSSKRRGDFHGYQWVQVAISREFIPWEHDPANGYLWTFWKYRDEKRERFQIGAFNSDQSIDDIRRELNRGYAEQSLDSNVVEIARYITWQRERIKNWSIKPLKPVPVETPPDPNRKIRRRWR